MSPKIGLAAVLAAALTVTACGGSSGSSSENDIVLGLIASTTGAAAGAYGIPYSNGVGLALDDVKSSGFLDGTGLSFSVQKADGGSELNGAVTAYNQVTRDGAKVVLSDSQTPIAAGISPLANGDEVLFLTGAGSKVENTAGYTFVLTDLGTPLKTLGAYLHKEGRTRVAAIVDGDNPAFPTMAKSTEAGLTAAGGTPYVATETVATADTDFSAVLTKIAAQKPDVVQISTLAEQAGNVLRQMKQSGDFGQVLPVGSMGWSPQVYTVAQDAAVGSVFALPWAPGRPESASFEQEYVKRFTDKPNPYSAVGYQAVWTIAVAAKQIKQSGGQVTSQALRDALPAASTSPELAQHGLIAGFSLSKAGMPSYPGVLATFGKDGAVSALPTTS
jgi:branched-chain amino acid transport system substrate-binding protein